MEKIKSEILQGSVTWRYLLYFFALCIVYIFFIPEEHMSLFEVLISMGGGPVALIFFIIGYIKNRENFGYRECLIIAGILCFFTGEIFFIPFFSLYIKERFIMSEVITGLIYVFTNLIMVFILSKHIDVYEKNESLNNKYKDTNQLLTESNEKLYKMANIDPLTQIYNRRKLIEELENLTEKTRNREKFALLFIDLDRFKSINDCYGHDVGDLLLKECVRRFKEIVGEEDFIARQGGDEFVIIFKNIKGKEYVLGKCNQILENMGKIFFLSGKMIRTSVSIGVAFYPEHARDYRELIKCGDHALYRSKAGGKNQLYIYDEELQKIQERKYLLENRLIHARLRRELYLLYQPQIDTKTGNIVGIEALLRWKNSDMGEISPKEFIPIGEESEMIHSLGEFVIEQATKDIKYLNEKYGKNIKVGINVSPKQFFTDEFLNVLKKNISKNSIDSKWLDIEITENMAMSNEREVINRMEALTELGMSISIDDFGTGYSSLAYFKNYPIKTLKIAMELVRDLEKGKQDCNIIKAITAMCREMGVETIAEGVETEQQFQILRDLGCDRIQGYYFSRPISLEEVENKFLQKI